MMRHLNVSFKLRNLPLQNKENIEHFHNMGNVYMQKKEYQKAVEAYKNALETTQKMKKLDIIMPRKRTFRKRETTRGTGTGRSKGSKRSKKDQRSERIKTETKKTKTKKILKKEGDEGDESDDKGDPNKEGDQKKEQKPKEQKPQNDRPKRGQLSPQQVESLLEAMNNQEKKVQDKINAKKIKGAPARGKKDW